MILGKATLKYEIKLGLENYSNHSASVTLDFSIEDEDVEGGRATLDARIDVGQEMARLAAMRSMALARSAASAAAIASGNGNGGGGKALAAPPPSAPAVSTPPPPSAAPPPPSNGNGNGNGQSYGPPKTARTFMGWLRNEKTDPAMADQAAALAKEWGRPWKFTEWNDADIQYLHSVLTGSNGQH
jgi:hypothetical protein